MKLEILSLTDEQSDRLVDLLKKRGFDIKASGHVIVKEYVENFPTNEDNLPLPVGYLAGSDLFLVNLNTNFPEDYHERLRQLYQEVIK